MALLKICFYLVALIMILVLAYYTTRVLGNGIGGKQEKGNMCVLDRMAVGRDTYLLVVKVQDQILLLGVSPAGVEKLEELAEYEKSPAAEPSDFASILADHVKPYLDKKNRKSNRIGAIHGKEKEDDR